MSRRLSPAIALATVVSSCSGGPIDPSDTVSLVIGDLSESSANAITLAAEAWRLEFGIDIDVEGDGRQRIPVRMDDSSCYNAFGFPTLGRTKPNSREILICPKVEAQPVVLFDTVRHEMGHVFGIRAHSTDRESVMTKISSGLHRFKEVDRHWFFKFNPEHETPTDCSVTPHIGEGEPTALAYLAEEQPQLVWAEEGAIRFAALSATEGFRGLEPVGVATTGTAAALRAHATKDGMLLSWIEGNSLNLSTVELDRYTERRTSVALEWPRESLYETSALHVESSYFYAVTVRDGETNAVRTLHVLEIDEATGAVVASTQVPRANGQLVENEGRAYLVTSQIDMTNKKESVSIGRLEKSATELRIVESTLLGEVDVAIVGGWAVPEPLLTVLPSASGIVVMLDTSQVDDAVTLIRMSRTDPLVAEHRILIAAGRLLDPTILEVGDDLYLGASMFRSDHYEPEVYVARLDAQTFAVEHPWERLSGGDTIAAEHPRLALADGQVVAIWTEHHDIRTRCVALP